MILRKDVYLICSVSGMINVATLRVVEGYASKQVSHVGILSMLSEYMRRLVFMFFKITKKHLHINFAKLSPPALLHFRQGQ